MATKKKLSVLGADKSDTLYNTSALEGFDGGAGLDKLIAEAEGATKGININLTTGVFVDSFGNRDSVKNVEIVVGTRFDDRMTGSAGTDYFIGGEGNDRLYGLAGNDELYGMAGNDILSGGDGHDYLVGGKGADQIVGGKGFDTADYSDDGGAKGIQVDLARSTIVDGYGDTDKVSGVEKIIGSVFADVMKGNGAANTLFGHDGDDQLFGQNGNDVLNGGNGVDALDGGAGKDMLAGGAGDDMLDGGKGIDAADYRDEGGENGIVADLGQGVIVDTFGGKDTVKNIEIVKGSVNGDMIVGSERTDYLDGWAGDDQIFGGKGADELYGAAGQDQLFGQDGSDYLDGGLGDDLLTGGASWDFFVARADQGHDTVMDLDDVDLIDMRNGPYHSYDEVMQFTAYVETQLGAGLRIDLGQDGSMTFLGVKELRVDDFVF